MRNLKIITLGVMSVGVSCVCVPALAQAPEGAPVAVPAAATTETMVATGEAAVPANVAAAPVDERIRQLAYNAGDVYTITTKYGYQTNIVFAPSEEIETISVGDKSVWQIIPSANRIFIRPMEEDSTTNMTVLTNRRSYQFDLKSLGPAVTEGNIYVATFVYPEDIIAAAQAAAAAEAAAAAQAQAQAAMLGLPMTNGVMNGAPPGASQPVGGEAMPAANSFTSAPAPGAIGGGVVAAAPVAAPAEPLPANVPFGGPTPPPSDNPVPHPAAVERAVAEVAPAAPTAVPVAQAPAAAPEAMPVARPESSVVIPPENANYNYTYAGSDALAPLQVFDDGQFTYLKYATAQTLPDAYVLDPTGNVVVVPHQARGDYMVVEAVTPEMILKNGSGAIHVYNESLTPR